MIASYAQRAQEAIESGVGKRRQAGDRRQATGDTVTARIDWARRHACGQHRRDVCHLIAGHLQDLTPLLGGLTTQSREFC